MEKLAEKEEMEIRHVWCLTHNKWVQKKHWSTHRKGKRNLEEHLSNGQHDCQYCYKYFESEIALNSHQEIEHPEQDIKYEYKCITCSKLIIRKSFLKEHPSHHQIIPLEKPCIKKGRKRRRERRMESADTAAQNALEIPALSITNESNNLSITNENNNDKLEELQIIAASLIDHPENVTPLTFDMLDWVDWIEMNDSLWETNN